MATSPSSAAPSPSCARASCATVRSPTRRRSPRRCKTFFAENDLPKNVRLGVANQRIVVRSIDLPPLEDAKAARRRRPRRGAGPHPDADGRGDPRLRPARAGRDRRRPAYARGHRRRPPRAHRPPRRRDQGRRPEGRGHRPRRLRHGPRARLQEEEGAVLYINVAGLTNVAVANQSGCLFTRAAAGGLDAMVATLAERRGLTLEHSRSGSATSASRRRWRPSRATPSSSPPPAPPSTRACTSWPTRSATR